MPGLTRSLNHAERCFLISVGGEYCFFTQVSQRLLMDALMGGGDEAFEEGVWLVGFAVEFGMELAGDEEGVFRYFDDFDEFAIGRVATEGEAGFFEFVAAAGVTEPDDAPVVAGKRVRAHRLSRPRAGLIDAIADVESFHLFDSLRLN